MTEIIAHRINDVATLQNLPQHYGAEIDLRDAGESIVLEHDPFVVSKKEILDEFLQHYQHGTLILNIKSERIEERILDLLRQSRLQNYFFLDCSFPMIKRLIDLGEQNIALRFSEYEGFDTIKNMRGKINWIWVDCFTKLPITSDLANLFKDWGYKLCLVSPDLQSRPEDIVTYKNYLREQNITFDAICVKQQNSNLWHSPIKKF